MSYKRLIVVGTGWPTEENNVENLLIFQSKDLAKIYIENWEKHREYSERCGGNDHNMPLPEFTQKLVETKLDEYCDRRIPREVRDQVKLTYKIITNKVVLIENRPYFRDPSIWTETPIAQFRFDNITKKWSLYRMDGGSKWQPYTLVEPSEDFDGILRALDADKTGAFWG